MQLCSLCQSKENESNLGKLYGPFCQKYMYFSRKSRNYYIHWNCIAWHEDMLDVKEVTDKNILSVVTKCLDSVCNYCKRKGASIKCGMMQFNIHIKFSDKIIMHHYKCALSLNYELTVNTIKNVYCCSHYCNKSLNLVQILQTEKEANRSILKRNSGKVMRAIILGKCRWAYGKQCFDYQE